jgi:PKD repeat protein
VRRAAVVIAACAIAIGVSGCGIEDQSPPSVTGPSESSLVVTASVSPSQVQRDGASQSTITINARGVTGPAVGRRFVVSATGPANTTLSASEVVTDVLGQATLTVTAPPSGTLGDLISVSLTPVESDGTPVAVGRVVNIGVTPSNTTAPVAAFTFSPAAPGITDVITFNATTSTDEGVACGTTCTFTWDFGDGSTATGAVVTKNFSTSGVKVVTLTVRDAGGVSSSLTQSVNVVAPAPPTLGVITVSPTPVRGGQATFFDAGGVTVGAGASIVEYTWIWGDGSQLETTTSAQNQHTFPAVGVATTFVVRVTVRDSLNRTATQTVAVAVQP